MIRSAAAAFLVAMTAGLFGAGCRDVDVPDHPDPPDHRSRDETSEAGVRTQELRLQTSDVRFVPAELAANTGVTTELTLENLDNVEHDFQIDEVDVDVIEGEDNQGEHDGGHAGGDLSVHADGGDTESVRFVVERPGSYEFYCTIPGHKEAGMVGTLTVE